MRVLVSIRSPCLHVCLPYMHTAGRVAGPIFCRLYSMLAEDAIKAAIKDLQDKGAVPKPAQHAEAA